MDFTIICIKLIYLFDIILIMGSNPLYLMALDKQTNKKYYIHEVRKHKIHEQELKGRALICYCGCKARLIFVSSGKNLCYFKSYRKTDEKHDGESELHKVFKYQMEKLGAIIPDENLENWEDKYRPDAIFEEMKLVIEAQTKNSGSSYKPHEVIKKNDYYRSKGYTPVWVMLGYEKDKVLRNNKGKEKTFKELSPFRASVLWDNGGILNYAFNVCDENEPLEFCYVRYELQNKKVRMSRTGFSFLEKERLFQIHDQWNSMKNYVCDSITHKTVSISGKVKL